MKKFYIFILSIFMSVVAFGAQGEAQKGFIEEIRAYNKDSQFVVTITVNGKRYELSSNSQVTLAERALLLNRQISYEFISANTNLTDSVGAIKVLILKK
ncbi:hypothetical protein Xmau_03814 [Xenorhabdus mauleonii]|uniref:Uncharacterized protein n=1 Tax=Xenorhabdus mauleonii TaxID=351675 RepID=A0A1I3V240_9GAMM|nr:hypothetical protein [Xenorhabdus mauleonii]PHM37597.1 hypothetical protein Xmau_03814 [Xenorhabdus mauleonii]SFJ89305.1 hypothetical protein SAMN05421680_11919 [Xenorhabdus mauleonii]